MSGLSFPRSTNAADDVRAPAKVFVDTKSTQFRLRCTCEIEREGEFCPHKLSVVLGEPTYFAGSSEQLTNLVEVFSITPIFDAARQLLQLTIERDFLNQEIENQKNFINDLIRSLNIS